jgi:hypothetical protein
MTSFTPESIIAKLTRYSGFSSVGGRIGRRNRSFGKGRCSTAYIFDQLYRGLY